MAKKILFVGAGAIGSYIGSFLSRAGHDVTLVDPWAEQVETIRKKGISVTGPHDPFEAHPKAFHLNESQRLPRDFEIAFVAMKVYDTAWATQLAVRHLAPNGFIVASENCWPDPIVASVAGANRSLGLIMSKIGVALWKPGQVERGAEKGQGTGHDVFRVGEHDGRITARAKEVAEILSVIDGSQVTDNLWGERWSKLCANSMGNPVVGMSNLGSFDIASSEVGRAITIHLASESARVGLALGYKIPKFNGNTAEQWAAATDKRDVYEAFDKQLTPTGTGGRNWRASMGQDVIKGRPTEIDYMNGHVVAKGQEVGVRTPVSVATVELVREIDAGTRKPEAQNIGLVLKRAGV
ncbi:MAG TPA: ketopantoate reductase C-terminal domain-containing protein [Methylomirabilota bacterium]|jgi:2-dehydropantoate 2-reductase|nr:ketopantoate reductase C-terminal domain-containing protein [Methylomirabilota bacterium]